MSAHLVNEALVDLELVYWQLKEHAQRGVTGSEIIQRNANSCGANGHEVISDGCAVANKQTFGYFQRRLDKLKAGGRHASDEHLGKPRSEEHTSELQSRGHLV